MMIKSQQGSQTVEFAFLCLPFIILLFAFIEVSRFLLTNTLFEIAVTTAARDIRTSTQGIASENLFVQRVGEFPLLKASKLDVAADYAIDIKELTKKNYTVPAFVKGSEITPVAVFTSSYQFQFLLIPALTGSITEMVTFTKTVLVTYE